MELILTIKTIFLTKSFYYLLNKFIRMKEKFTIYWSWLYRIIYNRSIAYTIFENIHDITRLNAQTH